jgi:hypothetical protein
MSKYHYYGVQGDYTWHLRSTHAPKVERWFQPQLFTNSDLIWCQGPKGGVRLVHFNWMRNPSEFRKYGYITTHPESIKEFMWVKLRAKDLN